MKLNPENPTPGLDNKRAIHYTKNEPIGRTPYYAAIMPNGGMLGTIEQEVDGFYYFFPQLRGGFWDAWILHDIARKLDALNEAWHIRLHQEFEKLSATEYTPTNPPTK